MEEQNMELGCPFCKMGNFLVRDESGQQGDYEADFYACATEECDLRCCLACIDPMRNHEVECKAAREWLEKQAR